MIRLKWTDAPAAHLKVCRNKIDDFDKKTFEECYKILKVTKMSTSSSTTSIAAAQVAVLPVAATQVAVLPAAAAPVVVVIAISTRIVLQGNAS